MIQSNKMKKAFAIVGVTLLVFVVGVYALLEGSCSSKTSQDFLSPNGGLKAFYETRDCGATTSTVYKVFISNLDGSSKDQIMKAASLDKMEILWVDEGKVEIHTDSPKIYEFQNFWDTKGRSVSIVLKNN